MTFFPPDSLPVQFITTWILDWLLAILVVNTAEWRDVNEILSLSKPFVTPEVLSQMERILTT